MRWFDRRVREQLMSLLVLGLLAYSWMYSQVSVPNERTRAYLTIAIVDHATLAIDAPMARFGRVFDLASFGGRYYTDKAPGASLLAVPLYATARLFAPASAFDVVDVINLVRTYLMLPFGLLGFWALRSLLRALSRSEVACDVCSLGFSLGSAMLHYSGAFYGHVIVAVLLLCCLRCLAWAGALGVEALRSQQLQRAALLGAGACAGLLGLTEYQAVPLAGIALLPLFWLARTRLLGWLSFTAGAAPFAFALLAYDAAAFGGPFQLSYQHLSGASLQALHGSGLAGATTPTMEAFSALLFSPHRGLVTTSPLFGLGLFMLPFLLRRMPRALAVTLAASVLYLLLIVSSSSVWFGGWSFGPRLLVPILGPLAISAAYAFDALPHALWGVLLRAAALAGIAYQQAVQWTFPELPPEFQRPLPDSVWPLLEARLVAPNLACKLLPLGPSNLLCAVLLLVACAAFVAFRGQAARPASGIGALVGAALTCWLLSAAAPSIEAPQQQRWVRQVQRWQADERRCRL